MSGPTEQVRAWIAKAESDLAAVRSILSGDGPFDTACFHCQQAIEKCMKGFLASRRQPFPFTHDLDELARLCDAQEPTLNLSRPEVVGLTDYAVRLRYDNDFWPTRADATAALRLAEEVHAAVAKLTGS